jgi:hypothetical protein
MKTIKSNMSVTTYKDFYIVENRKINKIDLVNMHTGKIRVVKTVQAAKWRITRAVSLARKVQRLV